MSMTRASIIRDYIVDYINSDLSKYEGIMLNAEELQCIVIFLEEREQYRAIGTVSEFKQLKEKATAKKPLEDVRGFYIWLCPNCKDFVF